MNLREAATTGFRLQTGSRLHFGLYRFGPSAETKDDAAAVIATQDRSDRRLSGSENVASVSSVTTEAAAVSAHHLAQAESQPAYFGGVGMMIRQPASELEFRPAKQLRIDGVAKDRAHQFVRRWHAFIQASLQPSPGRTTSSVAGAVPDEVEALPVEIVVRSAGPPHHGLGAGTQLALAVGHGLSLYFLGHALPPQELAASVGRGLRSAVGTHGFFRGGLIIDRGKQHSAELGILDGAFAMPTSWQVLVLLSDDDLGLHGKPEQAAFRHLPPIPAATTAKLQELTGRVIVPAVLAGDFDAFQQAIYEYGWTAGMCFRQVQGGPFASAWAQAWVDRLRGWGLGGVGQSSWGPALFCFASDPDHAD